MLARIPKRTIATALLSVWCGLFLGACATQKDPPALVSDPDAKKESQIPWNKQEKWESEGQLSGMSDRRTGANSGR
jgi:outer membrane biogenesis lipoprotein LolB